MKINNIIEAIGNTPLLHLKDTNIYAKLEYFNPLHSVKDRAALYMINQAEKKGLLKQGGTIIEPTSGNTGIGLAYIACQKGYKTILTMPASMSIERRKLLVALGAEIVLTDPSKGMAGAIEEAEKIAKATPNSFMPMQFDNKDNALAHIETTAKEIIRDMGDTPIDYLVLVFGSGGTITGLGKALKEYNKNTKVIAVEPFESPMLSEGKAGPHKIQGIGANFIPSLLDKSIIDEVVTVKGDDAIQTAQEGIKKYGTLIGISSGAALKASLDIQTKHKDATIVTLFPDTGERYLSTALFE